MSPHLAGSNAECGSRAAGLLKLRIQRVGEVKTRDVLKNQQVEA